MRAVVLTLEIIIALPIIAFLVLLEALSDAARRDKMMAWAERVGARNQAKVRAWNIKRRKKELSRLIGFFNPSYSAYQYLEKRIYGNNYAYPDDGLNDLQRMWKEKLEGKA